MPDQHWNGEVYWSKYQRAFIRVEKYDKFGPGTYVPTFPAGLTRSWTATRPSKKKIRRSN